MGIQNLYNANYFNNSNVNQNYGFNSPATSSYQQQSGFDMNSLFSLLLSQLLGQGSFQQPGRQQTNLNSLFGGYRQPAVNSGFPGVNINNSGYIGNININAGNQVQQNPWTNLFRNFTGKKPVNVDKTSVEVTPKKTPKVFIIGSHQTKKINDLYKHSNTSENLGEALNEFSDPNKKDAWGHSHDNDTSNDDDMKNVLAKMSDADKKLSFDKGQAYVVSEDGKVLDTIAANQVVDDSTLKAHGALGGTVDNQEPTNKNFQIIDDLGVDKTQDYQFGQNVGNAIGYNGAKTNGDTTGIKNIEEATGGKIKLNGKTYNVAATAIQKFPEGYSPLTFDLNGDGVKTSDKVVNYDIDGDGKKEKINDVADGTLSIRGGKSGKDLFGNNTDLDGDGKADGYKDGFEALKALAKKEGLINDKGDTKLDAKDLKILEDKYQLGMKTDGYNSKEKSLASLGINEIDLSKSDKTKSTENFDGQNNTIMQQDGATFTVNGKKREYADVWHSAK